MTTDLEMADQAVFVGLAGGRLLPAGVDDDRVLGVGRRVERRGTLMLVQTPATHLTQHVFLAVQLVGHQRHLTALVTTTSTLRRHFYHQTHTHAARHLLRGSGSNQSINQSIIVYYRHDKM